MLEEDLPKVISVDRFLPQKRIEDPLRERRAVMPYAKFLTAIKPPSI